MIEYESAINYIQDFMAFQKGFPYKEIGKVFAKTLPRFFEPNYLDPYIKLHLQDTYVKPCEKVDYYPPFWGTKTDSTLKTRRIAQIAAIDYLNENSTIYLSTDGGLFTPQDYNLQISALRLSAIIQTPLNPDCVVQAKSTFFSLKNLSIEDPSAMMTAGEFRYMLCMIRQISGQSVQCNEYGCPNNNCPLKQIDYTKYIQMVRNGSQIVGFLDRPVCANYLRNIAGISPKVIELYNQLLKETKTLKIPLISAKQSSTHKALMRTIIDILAGRAYTSNPYLFEHIKNFISSNPELIKNIDIDPLLKSRYNLQNVSDFILFLNKQWNSGPLQRIFIDYSIFSNFIQGFENRSNIFELHDTFLQKDFPNTNFFFFYVNYGDDWTRVEYVNSQPETVATHYYIQTSYGRLFYPFIVQMAHKKAVLTNDYVRGLQLLYKRIGNVRPTLKRLSKLA